MQSRNPIEYRRGVIGEPEMTGNKHPAQSAVGCEGFRLRRLLPLLVIALIAVVILAMGWHRQLSFETLARHHAALRHFIGANELAALIRYVAPCIAVVALSLPVGLFLTLAGGVLFGALVGGAAAVIGATVGAICIFLIARSALGEHVARRAGPLAEKLAENFRA